MSFYRIYRPQVISEIDNVNVRERLLSLLSKNKKDLPHAYFFSGPKGSGKTTAARIIAKLFDCEKPGKKGPCGTCQSCLSIAGGTNIDVLEIDAASNRGIDDVRELRDRIKLSPASSPYKIFIIDEVHMMTTEAFNALLKTLEEPPAHAVFVLATTDPMKVPATVRSRCMEITFAKATKDELLSALDRIVKKEKIAIDDDALSAVIEIADGAFRDAVKLLEQVSFIEGKITASKVVSTILKSDGSKREAFLTGILTEKNTKDAIERIEEFVREGSDMKSFLTDCLRDLQNDLVTKIKEEEIKRLKPWKKEDVRHLIKRFMEAYEDLRMSSIPQLPIELAVIEFIDERNDAPSSSSVIPGHAGIQSSEVPTGSRVGAPDDGRDPVISATARVIPAKAGISSDQSDPSDHLTLEKLTSHWSDFIEALKPCNHSVAGVIRGARPTSVKDGVVTIEAFYKFHQERLSDGRVRDILTQVLKKLFGVKVKVEIILGKK
jgi:DNA polymerase-3 subunit gamma/tau